jgi:hypothetical protein
LVYNRREELYTGHGLQQKGRTVHIAWSTTEGKDCIQGMVYNRREGQYTGHGLQQKERTVYRAWSIIEGKDCTPGKVHNRKPNYNIARTCKRNKYVAETICKLLCELQNDTK